MCGEEFSDVIGSNVAEQFAAFESQSDIQRVSEDMNCPVAADGQFQGDIKALLFDCFIRVYAGRIRMRCTWRGDCTIGVDPG